MGSESHKTKKLQQRILNAAALGSVKLLRGLVDSHGEYISKRARKKERRASKKRQTQKDEYLDLKGKSRDFKKRTRSGGREGRDRGEKRRRKEAEKQSSSDSESRESVDPESSESRKSTTDSSASDKEEKTRMKRSGTLLEMLNARDFQGLTPLHHACYAGSIRAVKYLISKGAGVHSRDVRGNTPLHIAAKMGLASLVSLFSTAGADFEAFNDDGETPSDILAGTEEAKKSKGDHVEQQSWYSHLADELSDDEWWGESYSEPPEPQEWETILLETLAENSQARGLYNEDLFSLRDYMRQEKVRKEKKHEKEPRSKDKADAAYKNEKRSYPEEVNVHKVTSLRDTQTYNQRWQIFSKSYNLCLSFADVPFPVPEGKEETLAQVLLQGVDPSLHRDALRKEILKWHPDKFLQKWGPKLQGPDHERIVARVNEISQALHVLYKDVATSK